MAKEIDQFYSSIAQIKRALRGSLLYTFLIVPVLGLLVGLVKGNFRFLLLNLIGIGILWGVIYLSKRGFWEEYLYHQRKYAKRPFPYKLSSALLLGVAVLYYGKVVSNIPWSEIVGGIIGTVGGYLLLYGVDPLKDKLPPMREGTGEVALKVLREATQKLEEAQKLASKIKNFRLQRELNGVIGLGREILSKLEEKPDDIEKMRKFLIVFVDSLLEVTKSYREVEEVISPQREEEFLNLLSQVKGRFIREMERLKEKKIVNFDINVELLRREITR
jgi:hypothetical protein